MSLILNSEVEKYLQISNALTKSFKFCHPFTKYRSELADINGNQINLFVCVFSSSLSLWY